MSLLKDVYYNFMWFLYGDAAVPPQYRIGPMDLAAPLREIDASIDIYLEERRRREWIRKRLWYNGPHKDCCPKCLQAGYIMGLRRTCRLDLLAEYPEIIETYEELVKDGLVGSAPFSSSRARQSPAQRPLAKK